MYRAFPKAKFYVCIDDDTYYFLGELRRISRQWNTYQPFISGAEYGIGALKNPVTGRQFNGTNFAHGGEGIVMSRAAVIKFVAATEDDCLEAIGAIEYSDVVTMLCANIAGIPFETEVMKGTLMMNNPPEGWPSQDACQPVLSAHHLDQPQMQALFLAEKATAGNVTFADLWKAVSLSQTELADPLAVWLADGQCAAPSEADSLAGRTRDRRESEASSADACQAECAGNLSCVAFCYETEAKSCALHTAVGHAAKGNCTSGIIAARYVCH